MQILLFANAISANMLYDPPIQLFEIRWPWPRSTPCSKKWGVSRPRWPRGSDATGFDYARTKVRENDDDRILHPKILINYHSPLYI